MSESTVPAIAGIHHISLTVRDIDASLAWYQQLFGAHRVPLAFPHYDEEHTGYGVLLIEPHSGLAIGLHTNTTNEGEEFHEARTGLDHVGFAVSTRAELEEWIARLDELDIEHSGIRAIDEPFPFATVVFRDPDNIQLELIAVG